MEALAAIIRSLMEREQAQGFAVAGATLALLFWSYFYLLPALTLRKIPRAGKHPGFLGSLFGLGLADAKRDFKKNGLKILNEAYLKHKGSMFRVQTLNEERVVLSPSYIEEINKSVPEGTLNVTDGLSERLMGPYTKLDVVFNSDMHIEVCKSPLTQNLPKLVAPLHEEAEYWLKQRIPGDGQSELNVHDIIVRVISGTATRMLSGPVASRDPEWLESAALYSYDVVVVAQTLRHFHPLLRPFVSPFLDSKKKLGKHLGVAQKTFRGQFTERKKQQESDQKSGNSDKPVDMVQWMVDAAKGNDRNLDVLAMNMLFMTLAGVHTSANTTMHALFDLCANPQFLQPLRDEIQQVTDEDGWTMAAMSRLKKVDSFIKESQRLNQTVLMTFNRKLAKSLKFADGTVLPRGTCITMPSVAVSRDPEYFENPDEFDGFRFYEKRSTTIDKSEANRQSFAAIGPDNLAFGFGKTACPGRFFAGTQIKTVLASIILNYDISFPKGQSQRPDNIYRGGLIQPDPRQKMVFRKRF
ncbi:Ent-kaurene oxidase-like protein [Emericellopsis cladophorae]|uniref:Ent-kaurene oxidase-like protein n=1 Tax=Emericellopsis cladophorae TaxID=2686198 RepID=A0A9P9Y9V7_9HYPO|nr:Ent-kaurene oxidase-like protein [Emericellopsis cladophorae]KAI6785534.1 Ent-kaurene oxidase-like protein [Emericellopsis cladophorae]